MNIKYLGHSSFLLTFGSGVKIVCDPYRGIGYEMPKVSADIVTVSHHHYDHDFTLAVSGNPKILDCETHAGECGVQIDTVNSFHDGEGGIRRGKNLIFKFIADGVSVCHLGDLGEDCSDRLIEAIGGVNVLLIPVGGNYTIGAPVAREYVSRLKPNVVIPMHYRVEGCNIDIDKIDSFLSYFADEDIENAGCERELSPADMRGAGTKIIVMKRCGK